MFEKEEALTTLCENACQGSLEKEYFNIHEVLQNVKGLDENFAHIYKNPYLTAGFWGVGRSNGEFVLNPFENFSIDKLVMLIPAPDGSAKFFWKSFDRMLSGCLSRDFKKDTSSETYVYSVKLFDDYFVQWNDIGRIKNIRIEFNPNKADIKKLAFILAPFPVHKINLIRISRIDCAIDYTIKLNPKFFGCHHVSKKMYYYDKNDVDTLYFGAASSDKQIRMYNKKNELKAKEDVTLPCEFWRVEAQVRNDWFFKFYEKQKNINPFARMFFMQGSLYMQAPAGGVRNFLLACHVHGIEFASKGMDKGVLSKYQKQISNLMQQKINFNMPQDIYTNCFVPAVKRLYEKIMELYQYGRNHFETDLYTTVLDMEYNEDKINYGDYLPDPA